MRRCIGVALALAVVTGCALPTKPDTDGVRVSSLGFHVQRGDYRGTMTDTHAVVADQWWGELMTDLAEAGLAGADPINIRGYSDICLMEPVTPEGYILYSDGETLVGGYYSRLGKTFFVPGDYPTASFPGRINSQPLKHEFLHHWCLEVLGVDCLASGTNSFDTGSHVFLAPSSVNIWDFTWQ